MKILMVAPQPFFEPRGTPISVYQRLQGLSALGHEVDLITYHVGQDVEIPGVTIHRAPSVPFIKRVKIGPSLAKIPLDIILFFQALWMLMRNRYEVIHSHEEAAFFCALLAPLFGVRHLYDMHSSLPKQLENFNFGNNWLFVSLFEWLEGLVLKSCDMVLTIGSDLEDYVLYINRRANHIRIENIALNSEPVEADAIGALRRELELTDRLPIVYTGSFERYQGLDLLFDSARLVVEERPEVTFVMVGGKPEQVAHQQDEVKRLGLQDHVIFLGIVPLEASLQYLEMGEILVSPRTEGLSVPLKIYSYLHSGTPTVATDIVAHTQIMDDKTAVIVDPTPRAYADGLLRLIENPELRGQIGCQAQAYARTEFSREGYLSKLERAYLSLKLARPVGEIALPDPGAPQPFTS